MYDWRSRWHTPCSPGQTMQEPANPFDSVLARLDRLAGCYVPSILRLDSHAVERIIDSLLAEIGEAVGTSQAVFVSSGDSSGSNMMRQWIQPGSSACGASPRDP